MSKRLLVSERGPAPSTDLDASWLSGHYLCASQRHDVLVAPPGIGWSEAIGNSLAFALYYLGFPLLLIYGGHFIPVTYALGLLCFIGGSVINTTAELLRKPFKADPNNAGKLYRGGLFKYAIHINYFGDVLWVLGCALLVGNPYALLIPLMLLALFVFSYIPTADKYLADKYGAAFIAYQRDTKELIPFIW
ncbi:DUF1295 domain-containing protein [Levilactobacillus brevis]|nr:DUF1295 domain-containing protein [Levilactobacillus brevis]